ncbi:MAG: hypothetical protein ACERKD_20750 [Prolixibacteraceae bacterium]
MKKYSDYFLSLSRLLQGAGNRIAITVVFVMATVSMASAQDFSFIEGSVHGFNVGNHEGNTFTWTFHDEAFNNLDGTFIDFIEGQFETNVTVQFLDRNRTVAQLVYLAVTETRPVGCSTTRAISIDLQPNNMYLDFASLPNADDCFNFDANYQAQVQVGMNFTDRNGLADAAIPESRFPLKVKYTVEDKTNAPGTVLEGNGGEYFVLEYKESNNYILEVTEAKGNLVQTVEYELAITDVVDKYDTHITHDVNRRVQIRVINHLPQSGTMDMALAYVVTPINYLGQN